MSTGHLLGALDGDARPAVDGGGPHPFNVEHRPAGEAHAIAGDEVARRRVALQRHRARHVAGTFTERCCSIHSAPLNWNSTTFACDAAAIAGADPPANRTLEGHASA